MRRRWLKIATVAIIFLVLLIGSGLFWAFGRARSCPMEAPGPTGTRVVEGTLLANYFPGTEDRPGPAILLLGGSEGGLSRDAKRQALALQAAGFTTLQLAYHCAEGQPNKLSRVSLDRMARALAWLSTRPGVDPKRLGLIGYSKGAEAALLLATRRPDVRAVVLGMPSSVVWDGIGPMTLIMDRARSSWTERGKDVPSLPYGSMTSPRGDTYGLHANGLKQLNRYPDALIPVSRVSAPILMVCGDLDRVWPACPMAEQVRAAVVRAGRPAPMLLRYGDAGHAVFGPTAPEPVNEPDALSSYGGKIESNTAAQRASWPAVIAFLRRTL